MNIDTKSATFRDAYDDGVSYNGLGHREAYKRAALKAFSADATTRGHTPLRQGDVFECFKCGASCTVVADGRTATATGGLALGKCDGAS